MSKNVKTVELAEQGYSVTVLGRNVLVTDAMKDYAIDKIGKVERFSQRIIEVRVTMDVAKLDHLVQIVMKVDHIKVTVHASSDDMYASVDLAVDKLQRKLARYKDRLKEHQAKSLAVVDMNVNVFAAEDPVVEINDEIEEENMRQIEQEFQPHEVVKTEVMPLKTLTLEEAIMKMDLSNDWFIVFRAEEDQTLKIIYRREDGNYGVVEVA